MKSNQSKKIMALFFTLLLLISTAIAPITSAETGTYQYNGTKEDGTRFELSQRLGFWQWPSIFTLDGANGSRRGYCLQWDVLILDGATYDVIRLEEAGIQNPGKVRWMAQNGYPNGDLSGVNAHLATLEHSALSSEEALAVTQLAIWHFANGVTPADTSNNNPKFIAAYDYFVANAQDTSSEALTSISAGSPIIGQNGNTISITLNYNVVNTSANVTIVPSLSLEGFAEEITTLESGEKQVIWTKTYPDLNAVDNFSEGLITLTGTQTIFDTFAFRSQETVLSQPLVSLGASEIFTLSPVSLELPNFTATLPTPDPVPTPDPTPVPTPDPVIEDTVSGEVTVNYVDTEGNTLSPSFEFQGTVGTNYGTSARSIEGYTLTETPENASGTFIDGAITVTYVYQDNNVVVLEEEDTPLGPATEEAEEETTEEQSADQSSESYVTEESVTPEPEESEVILLDEETPLSDGLPKTGQHPYVFYIAFGALTIALGLKIKK